MGACFESENAIEIIIYTHNIPDSVSDFAFFSLSKIELLGFFGFNLGPEKNPKFRELHFKNSPLLKKQQW